MVDATGVSGERRTNEQTEGRRHRVKPQLCGGSLITVKLIYLLTKVGGRNMTV